MAIAAESRLPVSTQVTPAVEVPSCSRITGSTGMTRDCMTANEMPARPMASSTNQRPPAWAGALARSNAKRSQVCPARRQGTLKPPPPRVPSSNEVVSNAQG